MIVFFLYSIIVVLLFLLLFSKKKYQKKELSSRKIFYDLNKTLKKMIEQQKALLDNIPNIIWMKNKQSQFLLVNKAFLEFFNTSDPEIIGKTDYDILTKEMSDKYREDDLKVMRTKKGLVVEEQITGYNNRTIFVETKKTPVLDFNGEVIGTLGIANDITTRKEMTCKLSKYKEQLEKLLEQRSIEIKKVSLSLEERIKRHVMTERELQRSNDALQQFAFVASHDLQEPLRMITSYLSLLSNKLGPGLDEKSKTFLKYATNSATHMHHLIRDLLEYSKIKKTDIGLRKKKIDLNEVLTKVKHNLKSLISSEKASLRIEPLPVVFGFETRYVQLFQNLIKNSINFRSQEDPVLQISCKEKESFFEFEVSDNGIGIDPRNQKNIFNVFFRFEKDRTFSESGTGIGLAICKTVVESEGGEIWVESRKGQGTTFHFTLPKK